MARHQSPAGRMASCGTAAQRLTVHPGSPAAAGRAAVAQPRSAHEATLTHSAPASQAARAASPSPSSCAAIAVPHPEAVRRRSARAAAGAYLPQYPVPAWRVCQYYCSRDSPTGTAHEEYPRGGSMDRTVWQWQWHGAGRRPECGPVLYTYTVQIP